jgi:hypothetical protein
MDMWQTPHARGSTEGSRASNAAGLSTLPRTRGAGAVSRIVLLRLCAGSGSRSGHLCPSTSSSSLPIPLPRILPAERMCDRGQRRPRQPISPGRPQGGTPPSLRTPTRQSPPCPIHHLRRINRQSSQVQVRRKVGDYRCLGRRDAKRRRTRAARSCCNPST